MNWLNDEIINFYMNLICERSKTNDNWPNVYAFNTFFYPKIVSTGQASVKRWTRKVDVFSYDLLIIPVHLGNNISAPAAAYLQIKYIVVGTRVGVFYHFTGQFYLFIYSPVDSS